MLEFGCGRERVGSNTFIGVPNAANLAKIFKMGKLVRGPYNPGTVPAEGYLAYTLCLRVMNVYSFFSRNFARRVANVSAGATGNVYEGGSVNTELVYQGGPTNRSEHCQDMGTCPSDQSFLTGLIAEFVVPNPSSSISQMFFDPYGLNLFDNFGHNIVFPYFEGMNLVDKDIIISTFREHFLSIIAKDSITAVATWKNLKNGLNIIGGFPSGRAISHAFRGIQLSIETATSIRYLVSNGEYYGFVLSSSIEPFKVVAFGKEVGSVDDAKRNNIIGSLNSHRNALETIVRLVREPLRNGTNEVLYDVSVTDIDTSRKLANKLRSTDRIVFTRATFDDDMDDAIEKLRFGDDFGTVTVSKISTFLEFVLTGNLALLSDFPALVRAGQWKEKDRVAFALGMFGEKVPSMNYAKPNEAKISFNLPRNQDPIDANVETPPDGTRPLRFLPFALVGIKEGTSQWTSLFNTGKFSFPGGTKTKSKKDKEKMSFTDPERVAFQVGNAPFFGQFYHMIKQISFITKEGLRGGKRRINEDEVETTARKRSKKAMVDMMEGME